MNRLVHGRLIGLAILVVAGAAALTGCSSSPATNSTTTIVNQSHAPVYTGAVPQFSGPWASAFAQEYRSTTSSLAHSVLADGQITDEEYAEVASDFVSCMKAKGFDVQLTGREDGTFAVTNSADQKAQQPALTACDTAFGVVGELKAEMARDPQNLDENTIVAACLVKAGVVPKSYTAAKYASELETQTFSFNLDAAAVRTCLQNPLGEDLGQPTK